LYQHSDVFVLPTLSDGFAITQLEAMAYGLPLIVTPNCGRVVEDGVTGFIVPPRDSATLADAIMRFVLNPNLGAAMSARCLERAKAFSVESYGRKLADILERSKSRRTSKEIAERVWN
jgi:glycosyltransferase involved in cell wall biosynthesis